MTAVTLIRWTTAPFNGAVSDVEYEKREDAEAIAQKRGLQLLAVHYVWNDSELVEDYTRWHWVVSTRCGDDPMEYHPEGPDVCGQDNPEDAKVELGRRFEDGLSESDWCGRYSDASRRGECDPCRAYRELGDAIDALDLADVERDKGFTRTIHGDTDVSFVYTIARVLSRDCPIHGRREAS